MRARCRGLDWTATALNAPEAWGPSLRTTAETVLASAFPAIVLWGPELVQLYNDAYVPFLGVKHPAGLGQPTRACWPEVWHLTAPIYARVRAGETVFLEEAHFPVRRQGAEGPVEDLYLTLSYSPVRGEAGGVDGVFITLIASTAAWWRSASRPTSSTTTWARATTSTWRSTPTRPRPAAAWQSSGATSRNASGSSPRRRPRADAEARAVTLAAVIDSIPDAVLVAGAGGVTLANQTALEQLGVPSVAALRAAAPRRRRCRPSSMRSSTRRPARRSRWRRTPIGRALSGERSHAQFLLRALGAAGAAGAAGAGSAPGTRPVRVAAAPIVGPGGAFLGTVAVLTDMTQLQAAAAERERLLAQSERARVDAEAAQAEAEGAYVQAQSAYAEAAAANRAKGEFLAVMSHELRTPLNAIGGYVELIELGIRGPVTPQQREDSARIQKSQRHLLGLINGVLNYSRAEAGAVHYDVGDVALGAVLATCETLIAPQARAKQLALPGRRARVPSWPRGRRRRASAARRGRAHRASARLALGVHRSASNERRHRTQPRRHRGRERRRRDRRCPRGSRA